MTGPKGGRWPQAETAFKAIYSYHWAQNKLEMGIFLIEFNLPRCWHSQFAQRDNNGKAELKIFKSLYRTYKDRDITSYSYAVSKGSKVACLHEKQLDIFTHPIPMDSYLTNLGFHNRCI